MMRTNIDWEIGLLRARWRMWRQLKENFLWLASAVLLAIAIGAVVVPYIAKTYREEVEMESIIQSIARVYSEGGVGGVRALCDIRIMSEVSRFYRCRVERKSIVIEQLYPTSTGPYVLRRKHIPRVGRLEATQKEASVL